MLREEQINRMARDCVHFRDERPCQAHLRQGATCRCSMYCPRSSRRLMVQLSSPTTVIRSSALVARFKAEDPNGHITYLTNYPELLPSGVDEPLVLDGASQLRLQMDQFDELYNLDMDKRACALTNSVNARKKFGFHLRDGHPLPIDRNAHASYLWALQPKAMEGIRPSQIRLLFQICGLEYRREMPRLVPATDPIAFDDEDEVVVGLYIPTGIQTSRVGHWDEQKWVLLADMLGHYGIKPVLLGHDPADRHNHRIAQNADITYWGLQSWAERIDTFNTCTIVVTDDEVGAELALAIGKEVVLLRCNHDHDGEIEVFHGRGGIAAPEPSQSPQATIADITPKQVFEQVMDRIDHSSELRNLAPLGEINSQPQNILSSVREKISRARIGPL